jgi:hypothetical protein
MSQRTQHPLTVVLFPLEGCNENFATLTEHHLSGFLNLETAAAVQILQQSATFLRLQCSDWCIKRHILGWETRSTAAEQFHIRIKEELHKYERIQKASMWGVMQALYHANLRPSWSRSSVTWKYNGARFFIHPGELPNNLLPSDIVRIAKRTCGIPLVETPHTHASTSASGASPRTKSATTSTEDIPGLATKLSSGDRNLITALQQDTGLAKLRAAQKTVECCVLRRKLKAVEAKLAYVVLPCKTAPKACQTDLQPSLEAAVIHSYLQANGSTVTHDTAAQTDNAIDKMKHHSMQTDSCPDQTETQYAHEVHTLEYMLTKQVLDLKETATRSLQTMKQEYEDQLQEYRDQLHDLEGRVAELDRLNQMLLSRCKAQQAELKH